SLHQPRRRHKGMSRRPTEARPSRGAVPTPPADSGTPARHQVGNAAGPSRTRRWSKPARDADARGAQAFARAGCSALAFGRRSEPRGAAPQWDSVRNSAHSDHGIRTYGESAQDSERHPQWRPRWEIAAFGLPPEPTAVAWGPKIWPPTTYSQFWRLWAG